MKTLYTSALAIAGLLASQSYGLNLETGAMQAPNPDIADSDLKFSKKRCKTKNLEKPGKDLCGTECDKSTTDGTCSWSYPLSDSLKNKSPDAACRCNPYEFKFSKKAYANTKCNDGEGCSDQEDGRGEGTCHKSYPWYDKEKMKSEDQKKRCKYPLEPIDSSDDSDDSDSDNGDGPDQFNILHLDVHNEYRRKHQNTPDMVYDKDLAADAMVWSMYLASINKLEHDQKDTGQGENLAWSSDSAKAMSDWATRAWYDTEIDDYDYSDPGYQSGTGHFTQVVWVGSTKLGCAEYSNYVTCRYSPQGNINTASYFTANVKPLKV